MENLVHINPDLRFIKRQRVDELIDRGLNYNVISIIAGLGYGKTLAISSYFNENKYCVWINLNPSDCDPAAFWEHLVYNITKRNKYIGEQLSNFGMPRDLVEYSALHRLIDTLIADKKFYIVLDDLATISGSPCEDFLRMLLHTKYDNLCIVLISSTRLGMGFYSLKGGGTVYPISTNDLKFSLDEAELLFKHRGIELSIASLNEIMERSSGWPIVIDNLANTLRSEPRADDDIVNRCLTMVYELLEAEYFSKYSAEIQRLLIKLSLIDTFPIELVLEISGLDEPTTKGILFSDSFIMHKDSDRNYAFYPTFKDYLRSHQASLSNKDRNEFLDFSGNWFLKNGHFIQAVDCFYQGKQFDCIIALIIDNPELFKDVQKSESIIEMLVQFPPESLSNSVYAQYLVSISQLHLGYVDEAKGTLLRLKSLLISDESDSSQSLLGEVYLGLAEISRLENNLDFLRYYRRAQVCLPEGSHFMLLYRFFFRNIPIFCDPDKAGSLHDVSATLVEATPYMNHCMNGQLTGFDDLTLAYTAHYTGDYESACRHGSKSLLYGMKDDNSVLIGLSIYVIARSFLFSGNLEEAISQIDIFNDYLAQKVDNTMFIMKDCSETWFQMEMGNFGEVHPWTLNYNFLKRDKYWWPARYVQGRYLLHLGEYDKLLAYLDLQETEYLDNYQFFIGRVYVLVSKAVCHMKLGDIGKSINILYEAYKLCYANGISTPFVELGSAMRGLISNAKKYPGYDFDENWLDMISTKSSSYAKRLKGMQTAYAKKTKRPVEINNVLSKTETLILYEIAQGFSREELADSHKIKLNSVHSHVKSIYNKLGAANSAEAVHIAHVRGIFK